MRGNANVGAHHGRPGFRRAGAAAEVPEEELVELRRRIAATRWPEQETVTDQSQGVQLATIQALAHYWGTDYDL
ncbi:MAG TPA: epoxide hydrolase N-terminal domain-containing protein, partial [Candidatus Limnocylindria bacterium]